MTDHLKPLSPGDKFPTNYRTWNPVLESVRRGQSKTTRKARLGTPRPQSSVPFINTTGEYLDRGDWVAIEDNWHSFSSSEFPYGHPVMNAVKPTWGKPLGWVTEPTENDQPGELITAGFVQAVVNFADNVAASFHHHADFVDDGDVTKLISVSYRTPYVIRNRDNGTGDKQSIVQIIPGNWGHCWAQAPDGGIPPAAVASPGGGTVGFTCDVLVRAKSDGTGYARNDLIKNGQQIAVLNYHHETAAEDGDRRVRVSGHYDGAEVEVWDCENDGSPTDFGTLGSQSGGGSI